MQDTLEHSIKSSKSCSLPALDQRRISRRRNASQNDDVASAHSASTPDFAPKSTVRFSKGHHSPTSKSQRWTTGIDALTGSKSGLWRLAKLSKTTSKIEPKLSNSANDTFPRIDEPRSLIRRRAMFGQHRLLTSASAPVLCRPAARGDPISNSNVSNGSTSSNSSGLLYSNDIPFHKSAHRGAIHRSRSESRSMARISNQEQQEKSTATTYNMTEDCGEMNGESLLPQLDSNQAAVNYFGLDTKARPGSYRVRFASHPLHPNRYSVARPSLCLSSSSSSSSSEFDSSQSEETRERAGCANHSNCMPASVPEYLDVDNELIDLRSWIGEAANVPLSERQRWHIVREIRDSEAAYLRSLEHVKAKFVEPLRRKIDGGYCILDERHLRVLFYQWEMLIRIHTELLRLFDDRLSRWCQDSCVADVFLDFSPVFYTYSTYFSNYTQATEVLDQLKQNRKETSQKCFPQGKAKMSMEDLGDELVKPVQRLPRYLLLLKELREQSLYHEDTANVDSAISQLENILRHAELIIEDSDKVQRLIDLQEKLDTNILTVGHRRLLAESQVRFAPTSSPASGLKACDLFLCNDAILIVKRRLMHKHSVHSAKKRFRASAPPQTRRREILPTRSRPSRDQKEQTLTTPLRLRYFWLLSHVVISQSYDALFPESLCIMYGQKSFLILFSSREEKERILQILQQAQNQPSFSFM